MKEFLIKLLSIGRTSESLEIVNECVNSSKEEHVELAYKAALQNASNSKIIYLLGGNNPDKCPFN